MTIESPTWFDPSPHKMTIIWPERFTILATRLDEEKRKSNNIYIKLGLQKFQFHGKTEIIKITQYKLHICFQNNSIKFTYVLKWS